MTSGPACSRDKGSHLSALPSDEMRQVMWRFDDRRDLRQLVSAARAVARGPVARLVVEGGRDTHEWTARKDSLLDAFADHGLTRVFVEPEYGGVTAGPTGLATSLAAYELAWVDGGAATCFIALGLAAQPLVELGTEQQKRAFLGTGTGSAGVGRRGPCGAFCLTEPLPYTGVDTGMLSGKVRIAEWGDGEPVLHVRKQGRFTNNMDFATFVTVAVASDDPRIKGTCMVILHQDDAGTFDRGAVTRKLAHQLASTRDPVFDMRVPASRIVGGYEVRDGVIVPHFGHARILESVFARTRVPAGVMTGAKLLSSIEPIIRYQRERFRGGEGAPGTPRHELGLQTKEDAVHKLVEIWAAGEAACSLGFAAARQLDAYAL
ncbi:MAG: acyl-CoA dehydrogenase, partial [Planctomycetes bacterium]|nr:acyl-CoA dehydrogenase [Planctomycetota bacterium]